MKKILFGIVIGLAIGGLGVWLMIPLLQTDSESEAAAEAEAPSFLLHTNGLPVLILDAATQTAMGLKIAPLEKASLRPEKKGYGRVLDPAPLAALFLEIQSEQAAYEASRKELERVRKLHELDQNVSARAVEVAQAAALRDQLQLNGAKAKLELNWGAALSHRTNLAEFVQALASFDAFLVRIDLPAGEVGAADPVGARIVPLGRDASPLEGQYLGPAGQVEVTTQGAGYLFIVSTRPAGLAPGAAVTGYLVFPGRLMEGVLMPRAAVVRSEGVSWVYVPAEAGENQFHRKLVQLGAPLENGWFVGEGFSSGDEVVVTGAQQMLSEEMKTRLGQGEEE